MTLLCVYIVELIRNIVCFQTMPGSAICNCLYKGVIVACVADDTSHKCCRYCNTLLNNLRTG